VAVQFSLSYDANGDPVLVENTVTGTRKVVSTSSVVSPYKSRFETPASGDSITDAEENQPDSNENAIMDYIMEMEKGADRDTNLSFVQKQNLERYTPEAIEASKKEPTRSQKIVKTVLQALIPYGNAAGAAIKALSVILPDESEEIQAIKQFYADPQQQALVESIPGMSNYNLVYGNPFDPSYGLANAAQKRIDRINKTLMKKDSSVLRDRRDKLQELIDREERAKREQQYKTTASEEIKERTTNIGDDVTRQQQRQANRDARAIERAYDRDTGDSYSGSYDASDDTSYSDPFDPGGGE
jgi:DNA-directed RNA polymerase beta' subunit